MKPIQVKRPDLGLDFRVPPSELSPRHAAGVKNLFYREGIMQTPFGFAKLSASGLPLGGGEHVLGLGMFREESREEVVHIVAVTESGIHAIGEVNQLWTDLSPSSGFTKANQFSQVSFVRVRHTDGIAANGSGTDLFEHILVCDGGSNPIYRWGGWQEDRFAKLAGADGYHEADTPTQTDHYAQQVNLFKEHVILLSPKTWDATAAVFQSNPRTVIFGKAGKLEGDDAYDTTATGAGAFDLSDTGDQNVWSMQLGQQLIVYQKETIWSVTHVGGTDVFDPNVEVNGLGLLAPHLLTSKGSSHFFIGNDFRLYEYTGGPFATPIGGKIYEQLKDELLYKYAMRCWLSFDVYANRLWIFFVPSGSQYAVKAYGVEVDSGAWTVRDFSHVWASGGITAVARIGSQSYFIGTSYQEEQTDGATYQSLIDAGTTYEDMLQEALTDERLIIGDTGGYVYEFDPELTTDDGEQMPAYHITPVFDDGDPDTMKWYDGITVRARGGGLLVSWRTTEFDTEDSGWSDWTAVTLNANEMANYCFNHNLTAGAIQFKFSNVSGGALFIESFKVHERTEEDEV